MGCYGFPNDFYNYDGVTAGVLTAHDQSARWDLIPVWSGLVCGTIEDCSVDESTLEQPKLPLYCIGLHLFHKSQLLWGIRLRC